MTSPHLPLLYGTAVRNYFFYHWPWRSSSPGKCPVYQITSPPLRWEQSTESAKASDLEALTLIPAASHSAAKHPSVHSRSQSKEASWTTSCTKHRDTVLRPQYWTLTTPPAKTKTKNHISEFFPRHIPAGVVCQLRKCHNSMNLETHAYSFTTGVTSSLSQSGTDCHI